MGPSLPSADCTGDVGPLYRPGRVGGGGYAFRIALYTLCGASLYAFGASLYAPCDGLYIFGASCGANAKGEPPPSS